MGTSGVLVAGTILVVTGLEREARLAAGAGVVTIAAGGSRARLRALLGAEGSGIYRAVVSFGIAGGLDPALRPGAVVLGTGVITQEKRWTAHAEVVRDWARRLAGHGIEVTLADIACVETPLLRPADKNGLRAWTGAAIVDTESHVAAAFAAGRGVPFAAIRVVCDPAERALPPLVGEALRPDGRVDLAAILHHVRRQPSQIRALPRLAWDARTAFASLGRVGAALGPGLGLGALGFGQTLGDVP